MKNIVLMLLLLSSLPFTLFAQQETNPDTVKRMSLSIAPEWNMNSRENFAAGASIGFNYHFADIFAAGVSFTASTNFDGITVLEPVGMFRWYFLPLMGKYSGFFAQADLGAYLLLEDAKTRTIFDGGVRAGVRLPLANMFYLEPYGRIGYPFMFGIGAAAGVRF